MNLRMLPNLDNPVVLEFEFLSQHGPYPLIEFISDKAGVAVDHAVSYKFIKVEERRHWGRMTSERHFSHKGHNLWPHKICSPVIRNSYELTEVKKVFSTLLTHMGGVPISIDEEEITTNIVVISTEYRGNSVNDTGIELELTKEFSKITKTLKTVRITHGNVLFTGIETSNWSDMRDTVLLSSRVVKSIKNIKKTEKISYNLGMYAKNPILEAFLDRNSYSYEISTVSISTQRIITLKPKPWVFEL